MIRASTRDLMGLFPALFDGLSVPEGVDRELTINTILAETDGLSIAWIHGPYVAEMIRVWSERRTPAWARMWKALTEQYNPLHNFDRYEEWDDSRQNVAETDSRQSVSAYNTPDEVPASSNTARGNSTDKAQHSGHLYGNIGITTSVQMLEGELNVRKNDFYNLIASEFIERFCLLIY